jgi:predicted DNA-binding transcriptional regulator YafY
MVSALTSPLLPAVWQQSPTKTRNLRKATRLFEIIQLLRLARLPMTAANVAERLECGQRTVYRDIAALQAMRVPIDGERGLGYILRPGFDLPPLMFTAEESEALVVALALLQRTGDTGLHKAARAAGNKIAAAMPDRMLDTGALYAWGTPQSPAGVDLSLVRQAIREERMLALTYADQSGALTDRVIRPLAVIYYAAHSTLVGWCELRHDIRNFRADRVQDAHLLDDHFKGQGDTLRALWVESWQPS